MRGPLAGRRVNEDVWALTQRRMNATRWGSQRYRPDSSILLMYYAHRSSRSSRSIWIRGLSPCTIFSHGITPTFVYI